MEFTNALRWLASFLLLQALAVRGLSDVNYGYLGNFSMAAPWYTIFRPLPAPQSPDVITTGFYLYTRAQPARYYVTKLPNIDMTGSDFSGVKPTFLITHGFASDGNETWIKNMTSALLNRFDANVIAVDWGKGARQLNYFQVASNPRVVAAETVRLINYLVNSQGFSVSRLHMIGHSLGAHTFSYVAKALPGVARLTALDPAAPGFEGYDKAVRLDVTDAAFVEVIHTDALPLVPFFGVGMMGTYGHVDYYVNGGFAQPGCLAIPNAPTIASFFDLINVMVEDIKIVAACPHGRSHVYFLESIANANCLFWGHTSLIPMPCTSGSCSPLGVESINFQGRGSYQVTTNQSSPFCLSVPTDTNVMMQYRSQRDIVVY